MKRSVVKLNDRDFLGRKAINLDDCSEGSCYIGNINEACIFNSLKEAKSVWAKNKKRYKQSFRIDTKGVSFEELPSKGLDIKEDERELFIGFDTKFNTWDRYAVKEISGSEALHKLADFVPSPEGYSKHMSLYFWDTYENGSWGPNGGFNKGGFSSLYGFDHENNNFISENLVGTWQYKEHAGAYRLVDSGYRVPIYIDGKLSWCNKGFFREWIKEEGHKIEEIKPAFETSIDLDNFIKELKESLEG